MPAPSGASAVNAPRPRLFDVNVRGHLERICWSPSAGLTGLRVSEEGPHAAAVLARTSQRVRARVAAPTRRTPNDAGPGPRGRDRRRSPPPTRSRCSLCTVAFAGQPSATSPPSRPRARSPRVGSSPASTDPGSLPSSRRTSTNPSKPTRSTSRSQPGTAVRVWSPPNHICARTCCSAQPWRSIWTASPPTSCSCAGRLRRHVPLGSDSFVKDRGDAASSERPLENALRTMESDGDLHTSLHRHSSSLDPTPVGIIPTAAAQVSR